MSVELFLNSVVGFATLTGHCQNHCSSQKCNSFIIQVSLNQIKVSFESYQVKICQEGQPLYFHSYISKLELHLKSWYICRWFIHSVHTFTPTKLWVHVAGASENVFLTLQKEKMQSLSSVRWCQRVQLKFFLSFKESKAFTIQELSLKSNEALPGWIQNTWATCLLQLFNASIMELKTCKVFYHQFIYISTFWYFVITLLKNICDIVEIYHLRPQ